jgi:hypothetical protein
MELLLLLLRGHGYRCYYCKARRVRRARLCRSPPPPPACPQESAMETARLTLRKTVKRLDRVARKTRSNHVVYVFLFGLALFMAFYAWTKVQRLLAWIF